MTTNRHVARPRQCLFRIGLDFVAVKPVRLTSTITINPGERVKGLRRRHLRSLYRRKRIGVVGDPWTESMLEAWKKRVSGEKPKAKGPIAGMTHVGGGWWDVEFGENKQRVHGREDAMAVLEGWKAEAADSAGDESGDSQDGAQDGENAAQGDGVAQDDAEVAEGDEGEQGAAEGVEGDAESERDDAPDGDEAESEAQDAAEDAPGGAPSEDGDHVDFEDEASEGGDQGAQEGEEETPPPAQ